MVVEKGKSQSRALLRAIIGLGFAGALVVAIPLAQIVFGEQFGASMYWHLAAASIAAAAVFLAFGCGIVPRHMRGVRLLSVGSFVCIALYCAQMAALLLEPHANNTLQVVAGLFGGTGAACSYLLWIDALMESKHSAWPIALFAAAAVSFVLTSASFFGQWGFVAVPCVCAAACCAMRALEPPVKVVSFDANVEKVKTQRDAIGRIVTAALLLSLVWGYCLHHFVFYSMVVFSYGDMLASGIVGVTVIAVWIAWALYASRAKSASAFSVLKALPVAMVPTFVPLQYFAGFLSFNMQMAFVFATGAVLAVLFVFLSGECANALRCKPQTVSALSLGSIVLGLFAGAALNALVGTDTTSLLWAIAPVLCLLVGIVVCNFTLDKSALAKDIAKGSGSEAFSSQLSDEGAEFKKSCIMLAGDCGLTAREVDVLYMLVQGYSVTRVAESLHIAEGTATTHKRHIYQKLDVHSKNELIDKMKDYRD